MKETNPIKSYNRKRETRLVLKEGREEGGLRSLATRWGRL